MTTELNAGTQDPVYVTDALIAATRPLDSSGADEIVEVTEEKADD